MINRLTYGLDETGLYVATSQEVVHSVASRYGPMLDEFRRHPSLQVHQRVQTEDGGVGLKFNFLEIGKRYNGGRRTENAAQIFDVIQQFEDVAAKEGWQDPRINSYYSDSDRREYWVNVERPIGTDKEVRTKIETAMVKYSKLLGWDRATISGRNEVRVRFNSQTGISLESSRSDPATLSTDEDEYSPASDRIELGGISPRDKLRSEVSFARLIAFTGLLATLRAPDHQDALDT